MRSTRTSLAWPMAAALSGCALVQFPTAAWGGTLEVANLWKSTTVVDNTATGTIEFNLRFQSFVGAAMGYDLFSAQILITKVLNAARGTFTLDEFATENTGTITPYWLPGAPTGNQNASQQGNPAEFRFSDFVHIDQSFAPAEGQIVAHYVINFSLDSAAEFGTYRISAGDPAHNYFSSDLTTDEENTIVPEEFVIPEPATGLLLSLSGMVAIGFARRRRRD